MTAAGLAYLVGGVALARLDPPGIRVRVRILDARQVFGRTDALVQPLDGEGKAWVSLDRLALEATP